MSGVAKRVKARIAAALALAVTLAACEPMTTKTAEYRPEEAGTVDHAMCLLGFTAIPLRELVTGHHLVDATLNGRPGTFVLDTGANATVLHAGDAEQFGITKSSAMPGGAVGLGGRMKASQVRIESLEIGSVPIRQRKIMMADLSQIASLLGPLSGRTVYGIVGQDVMKEHRAVIDVARPILYLMEADEDPAPVAADRCRAAPDKGAAARKS